MVPWISELCGGGDGRRGQGGEWNLSFSASLTLAFLSHSLLPTPPQPPPPPSYRPYGETTLRRGRPSLGGLPPVLPPPAVCLLPPLIPALSGRARGREAEGRDDIKETCVLSCLAPAIFQAYPILTCRHLRHRCKYERSTRSKHNGS